MTKKPGWPCRYHPTAFRGLPPSRPFVLDAAFLALLLDWPLIRPSLDAIQLLEPRKPSKIPGTYRSASRAGKWMPKPDGLISIALSCEGLASSSPSTSRGEKATRTLELSSTTIRPALRCAATACGTFLSSSLARWFAISKSSPNAMNSDPRSPSAGFAEPVVLLQNLL